VSDCRGHWCDISTIFDRARDCGEWRERLSSDEQEQSGFFPALQYISDEGGMTRCGEFSE